MYHALRPRNIHRCADKLSEAKESVKSTLGMGNEQQHSAEQASEKGQSATESAKETIAQGADKTAAGVKSSVGK